MPIPRIYLAGPEVFLPDALGVLAAKAALAREMGFEPVTPLDNQIADGATPFDTGMAIYLSNKALMDGCDAVIANLTPFRGPSGDVGTAFEVGYMTARGARVLAYSNSDLGHFAGTRDNHYERWGVRPRRAGRGRPLSGPHRLSALPREDAPGSRR